MRLTFVHGRAQEGKSELEIKTYWTGGLHDGYVAADIVDFPAPTTRAPFYGDTLIRLMRATDGVALRSASAGEVDPIARAMAERMAERSGTSAAAAIDAEAVERGPDEWGWVQAVLRSISERVLNQVVDDVMVYLNRVAVRDEVHAIVRPHLEGAEPTIVVAHSLGSVVAYALLADLGAKANVPLLVTAGSPLGLPQILDKLEDFVEAGIVMPDGVESWLNATDERDVVALYEALTPETFIGGIENITDIKNPISPHDIAGYLADKRVAGRVGAALSAT